MSSPAEAAALVALRGIRAAVSASIIEERDRRAVEIYLLVTVCNVAQVVAADVCGCTKQNVSKRMKCVEDKRDKADFDRALAAIERMILGDP
jgi:hypothetical protein